MCVCMCVFLPPQCCSKVLLTHSTRRSGRVRPNRFDPHPVTHPTSRSHADDMCPGLADKYPEFKCALSEEPITLHEPVPYPDSHPAQTFSASSCLSPAASPAFSFIPPSVAGRGGRGAGQGGRGEELQVPRGESVCHDVGRCGHCRLNYLWRWARAARVGLEARDVMFPRLQKVPYLTLQ